MISRDEETARRLHERREGTSSPARDGHDGAKSLLSAIPRRKPLVTHRLW